MAANRSSTKELLVWGGFMAVGLGAVVGVERFGAHFGVTRWTTFAVALAIFLALVTVTRWRKLYPPNRPGLVLMLCGISALAICSIINELFHQFFSPSRVHLLAAVAPAFAYELFRYVRIKTGHPEDEKR
jgi:hypothetical protein